MKTFTDDEMNALLPAAKAYSVVILRQGPGYADETAPAVIWEHGRRNFGMNDDPGVQAGVFTFEVHPCRGFPGDSLP
jgi:hypothetical protein